MPVELAYSSMRTHALVLTYGQNMPHMNSASFLEVDFPKRNTRIYVDQGFLILNLPQDSVFFAA